MLSAARESIAVSSGSDSGNATLPDGGSAAESSSPEPSSSPDAVIDIPSSAGAPNEMLGPALSEDPAYSSGNPRRCDVLEEWEARGDVLDGEALTVILKSPWPWAEVVLRPEELERGRARGIPPRLARRYLERNIAMVMFPQWEHDSSTSAASACLKPKHEEQRSWPSDGVRKRPHPETHEREAIFKKTPVARGALLDCSLFFIFFFISLLGALKRRGEVAAWPQRKSSTGQRPPLTRCNTNALLWDSSCEHSGDLQWLGSEAKSWCAFARALLLYPHRGAECAWRNTHANCHWLVLLTLEGDWALRRDPISQSLWRYVERDWLIGNIYYQCWK